MIEPLARCNNCFRDISSAEMTKWSGGRNDDYSLVWWYWQIYGVCDECATQEEEES